MMQDSVKNYLRSIENELMGGNATEHTHRPALKALVETLESDVIATNEPKRVECGAPDFVVSRSPGLLTIGYIEAKDVGKSLDEAERSAQLQRYLRSLENLVLTDYLELRWYVDNQHRRTARLARVRTGGKLIRERDGEKAVIELLKDFLSHAPEPISTPKELAQRMARLTHLIRDIIVEAFEREKASPLLHDLRKAFAAVLIPDLDQPNKIAEFADMYAQTIAYGLFAARCNHPGPGPFQRFGAAAEIPKTNPFLRKLFETIAGTEMDGEPYTGFVDDLVQVLDSADIESILDHFGKRSRREDPVVHFYETFLATYDPKLREMRGVYYTPDPVVSYIVRSVDHLLSTCFGLSDGLADSATIEYEQEKNEKQPQKVKSTAPRVLILDPACGTGTFIYAVVDHIREKFIQRGNAGLWSGYVQQQLLPRLFGFELLMAPYAVAHFKLGMQLAAQDLNETQRRNWEYNFSGDERLGIYLTNTLEEAEKRIETLFGPLRVITEEANAAARIKRDLPIMVILGNPPYSTFGRMNKGRWITGLMKDWKPTREKKWNPDDFMKFMRWAQWRIERTGAGVLAFITNNSYIDGITHRRMRQSLAETFTDIYILDLHGSSMKKEKCPDGSKDENVFDIRQGVAIGIFVKEPGKTNLDNVYHADLWGLRKRKYAFLSEKDISTTAWVELKPTGDQFFFVPRKEKRLKEYEKNPSLTSAFLSFGNGIGTDRDSLFYDLDPDSLADRIQRFYSTEGIRPPFSEMYRIQDSSSYPLLSRRSATSYSEQNIQLCLYRPFDLRWLYYDPKLTSRPAYEIMQHMMHPNLAILVTRQVSAGPFRHVFVGKHLVDRDPLSLVTRERTQVFPLYLYLGADERGKSQKQFFDTSPWPAGKDGRIPNLSPKFVTDIGKRLKLTFIPDGNGDLKKTFGAKDVLNYIYAILHSPIYRERYAEFLKIDFPRVPLTSKLGVFGTLCHKGEQLISFHLLESPALTKHITSYPIRGTNVVDKGNPRYIPPGGSEPGMEKSLQQGRVYVNKEQYFEGVSPEVWEFYVGGYKVCEKWLKERRNLPLSYEDLSNYQKVIVAINKTIQLMKEIDEVISDWPIR